MIRGTMAIYRDTKARRAFQTLLFSVFVFFVVAGFYGACLAAKPSEGDIVARWGNRVITKQDLDERISAYPPEVRANLEKPEQRQQFLESLIQIQIVAAEAKKQNIHKKKIVATRMEDATNTVLLREYINLKLSVLKEPTDQEVEKYFGAHRSEYVSPVYIRAQHILIESKPDAKPEAVAVAQLKADSIYKELIAGADFGKLALKYSDDPESKAKEGDLGLITAEQMVPEFSNPVFAMKKGELGKPFKTPFGFHIVKVTDLIPPKQMELKEVIDSLRPRLDNENRENLIIKELERLKEKYNVKIKEPVEIKQEANKQ